MAQITSTTTTVTPTSGEDWINIPLNPQKVLMAYKTTEAINGADLTLYPAIAFLVDYSFKIKDNPFVMTKENWSFWIYASGDTATRDADFLIVNDKIGEVGSGGGGEVNTASNVGAGEDVFKQKTGVDLEFRTLIAGTNITITANPNDLTIDSSGSGLNVLETATLDGNIITPAQLLVDQDDYNPTGFATCQMIRQDINGNRVITGFVAPSAGVNRIFGINNLSITDNIKFKNNDAGSAAANRLLLRDSGPDKTIKENETAIFWYDHTSARWRPYNRIG